ncbi:MAG: aspartate 1-decarboxylase [Gemmatimonadetes bacterium]|uniref:Aspartate 1-decarboxylase n=1 Tax=Candidatus Kutchimonas denitrificans TaxID=3056748 RepID=A0AAE5C8M3_9BACT|nr:aspartate 1-decarboxylase [Gemmatimonadota bacterium]NIR74611.1 aspartate 1-decarboxylase [Candidatus Kutchimonas denitrificans]NIS02801.1 aspartate 1-decarboxylase [Gemmatimonadota bacterium]NIT68962.1 aspartate 1-decarboxylase [Gemmatimonadota bacterium]NIU52267.1 aspartate 1-decarboxylase [Gemmatimonadota bacterium]
MRRELCKSKIHGARVTQANLYYEGSLTLDMDLADAADLVPYERIQVVNINNGARLETYVLPGERGSGEVALNGAAARLGSEGDQVILISYAVYEESEIAGHEPRVVFVDEKNRILDRGLRMSAP